MQLRLISVLPMLIHMEIAGKKDINIGHSTIFRHIELDFTAFQFQSTFLKTSFLQTDIIRSYVALRIGH